MVRNVAHYVSEPTFLCSMTENLDSNHAFDDSMMGNVYSNMAHFDSSLAHHVSGLGKYQSGLAGGCSVVVFAFELLNYAVDNQNVGSGVLHKQGFFVNKDLLFQHFGGLLLTFGVRVLDFGSAEVVWGC